MSKETRKKDLSSVIEMLKDKRGEEIKEKPSIESKVESVVPDITNDQHIYLESIDTNSSAVYQTVVSLDTKFDTTDLIKAQVRIKLID